MRPGREVMVYMVTATFNDSALADAWLRWLRDGHVAAVLAGGATAAEVIAVNGPTLTFEVRYRFPSRESFERYERDHAPQLRAEGLRQFPPERGIRYHRSNGLLLDEFPKSS